MGEKLNRSLQRTILERLSADYPADTDMEEAFDLTDSAVAVNAHYLQEHGLIVAQWVPDGVDYKDHLTDARITARGLDFLADDGGLGAILGTVTIRFHDDTLRDLLIRKVESAEGDTSIKDQLVRQIRQMPAAALTEIARRVLDVGLDSLPKALSALRSVLPI